MGQVRGIQLRHGTFFARLVIPAELRSAMGGKTELRERLGTDRREAERNVYAVMARFHDQISAARQSLASPRASRPRPMTIDELARTFYAEELAHDDRERMATAKLVH